jgi:hypothetical protein
MHTEGFGASPDTGFHEPSGPVGARFIISFAIAYFGFWITLLTPPIVALAVNLSTVLPESARNAALGLIPGVAGVGEPR